MQQFREEEVTIDIPGATVIFPKKFDRQIARVRGEGEDFLFVLFVCFICFI